MITCSTLEEAQALPRVIHIEVGAQIHAYVEGDDLPGHLAAPDPRDQIAAEIRAERDRRTVTGGFKVAVGGTDRWFHSDTFSRTQQLGLVMLGAAIPPDTQWKTMDGTFVTMTPELAQQIFAAATLQDIATFAAAEAHIAGMRASGDPASYVYVGGWPVTFADASAG